MTEACYVRKKHTIKAIVMERQKNRPI